MSLLCCVRGCSNGNEQHLDPEAKFFSFPSVRRNQGPQVEELTRRRRMAWVSAVKRPSITFEHVSPLSYVCSRHFHKGQPAYETLDTDPDWVPSLHLGHPKPTNAKRSNKSSIKRSKLQMAIAKQRRSITATFLVQYECCVVNCGGKSHNDRGQRVRNGLTFFSFPLWRKNDGVFLSNLSKRRRAAWVEAVGRADITFDDVPDEARVCSRHFKSGKPAHEMMEKDPDWVPSLHLNNEEPHIIRNQVTVRGRPIKKRLKQTVTDREKPSTLPWKDLRSRLQGLIRHNEQSTETPQVDNTQNFKDFFRNALKASLDACLDSGSQSPAESRFSLDPSWFSAPEKSSLSLVRGQPASPCAPSVSEAPCENCVRLQERIAVLEERLAAPQFLQDHNIFSKWTQPLSQTELKRCQGPLPPSPEKSSSPPKAKFHLEWLTRHWFLRYSPKLNMMWCHVCRLYGGVNIGRKTFVKGTRSFQNFAIVQHSRTSYHQECAKKFEAHKGYV